MATTEAAAAQAALRDEIKAKLKDELGLGNIMEVPRLEKIVRQHGRRRGPPSSRPARGRRRRPRADHRPEAVVTKAKKSIAGFKLREGNAIGAKVTLRGDRMWEFFDRLISLAIPRIRDFRGPAGPQLRRPRQLHVRRDRAADLPRDRLRQGRRHSWHGHHHRHDRASPTPRARRCSMPSASRSTARTTAPPRRRGHVAGARAKRK